MAKPKLPSAIRFWIVATGFEHAADAAYARLRSPGYVGFVNVPVIFLYARSIELALKACVRQHTSDPKIFEKKLGHRIDRILCEADQLGICTDLELTNGHRKTISAIGEDYSDKWYEYPEHFWRDRPKIENLKSVTNFLIPKVQIYVDPKKARTG